ncbi:uncharacterized protein [Palaemon carinicauda]|uniref:uncharacterized protein n=1 Tax=Palaemon carinicauda TaxID=392227 RepID=UPI0035B587B4
MPEDVVRGELDPDAEVKTSPVFDIRKKEPKFIESIATIFSSWLKFLRTVAWMTRFIRHMQKARPYSGDSLSSAELRTAENLIWRLTQRQEYEEELSTLSKKERSLKRSSKLIKLRPFLEDGLLHVGGLLQKSTLADTAKNPIILPSSSLAVKLMVRATHESCGHCGQSHLMTQLRTNYWIVW